MKPKSVIITLCKCGGWVMVANNEPDVIDGKMKRQLADMVVSGFEVKTISFDEYRGIPGCGKGGRCTTGPATEPVEQAELFESNDVKP